MPQEISEPAAALPPDQSALGDGVPSSDPAAEIPVGRHELFSHFVRPYREIRHLAEKDRCLLKLLNELIATEAQPRPTAEQLLTKRRLVQKAAKEYEQMANFREHRTATIKMLEARVKHRLSTLKQQEDNRRVSSIRKFLAPRGDLPEETLG